MRRGIVCAAVAAAPLALPGTANAAQVYMLQSGFKSNVLYTDRGAEDNTVVAKVIMGGYGVLLTDSTATITTVDPDEARPLGPQPCALLDEHRALCVNPTPHPEAIGGFDHAFLNMGLGLGDNSLELDPASIPPAVDSSTAGGDDVVSLDNVVSAYVSDHDGANILRVGRTQGQVYVRGGRGPDRIDVKNRTGGDDVECSWLSDAPVEGDRVRADRDDVIDADCG